MNKKKLVYIMQTANIFSIDIFKMLLDQYMKNEDP